MVVLSSLVVGVVLGSLVLVAVICSFVLIIVMVSSFVFGSLVSSCPSGWVDSLGWIIGGGSFTLHSAFALFVSG